MVLLIFPPGPTNQQLLEGERTAHTGLQAMWRPHLDLALCPSLQKQEPAPLGPASASASASWVFSVHSVTSCVGTVSFGCLEWNVMTGVTERSWREACSVF